MKTISILFIGIFIPILLQTQAGDWKLKKEVDDLKVYSRDAANSGVKEIKVNFSLDASLTNVIAAINDIEAMPAWVYCCSETRVVKRISPKEVIYYGRVSFPLTMSDRDYVVKSKLQQNAKTKEVTIVSNLVSGYVKKVDKCVRVPKLYTKWCIKPLSAERVQIEYQMASDPGGSIPDWLINMAIDKGPIKSIESLKGMLQQPKYQNAKLSYIKDFPAPKVIVSDHSK